ncbi:putative laminarinase [Irpex rosettiformis]|uniref:Laminarinase n=1 Tax=Irpex rosettiformis TaxID=378272 RepID=A0ACB8U000_9APHY|nr:putative laminarinase [Irpex rosettiformis]
MRFAPLAILTACSLLPTAFAGTYSISDTYIGSSFLSGFVHEAIADPTHGRVNYVDQATAVAQNLTYAHGNTFIIRADHTTTLSASGPGRNSVRIRSQKTYTTHVAVFDIVHMPQGCSTWPAAWETDGSNWPNGGEVDIVSVNDQSPNLMSLHTSANCNMPASRTMTGTATVNNCDVNTDGNSGCGVQAPTTNSYGPSFNSNGGGFYAMERTNSFIKVWFWPRNAGNVPSDLKSGAASVNTANWGTPTANFPNTSCDIASHFDANNIIINLTLCGDWAGQASVFNGAGCAGSCVDFVNNNPSSFTNAYWQFNAVRVYQ